MSTAVGEEKVTWRCVQIKYYLSVQTGKKCYLLASYLEFIFWDIDILFSSMASKDTKTETPRTTVYYPDQKHAQHIYIYVLKYI